MAHSIQFGSHIAILYYKLVKVANKNDSASQEMKKVGSDDVPVTHGRTLSCLGGSVAARTAVPVLGAACVRQHRPRARS